MKIRRAAEPLAPDHWQGGPRYVDQDHPYFPRTSADGPVLAAGCGSHDAGALPRPLASAEARAGSQDPSAAGTISSECSSDRSHPLVQLHTTLGDITIKLDAEHAPITVDIFLALCRPGRTTTRCFTRCCRRAAILGGGYDTFGKEKPRPADSRNEAHNG